LITESGAPPHDLLETLYFFPSSLNFPSFPNHPISESRGQARAAHPSWSNEIKCTVRPDFNIDRLNQGTGLKEMVLNPQPTQADTLPFNCRR
jgi:hypothetical protein